MLDDRFWSKVLVAGPTDCWEWQANKNNKGYGLYRPGGLAPKRLVHRLSYEAHNGPIPAGMVIRHSCDNPACVNPAHLLAGTQKENMEDAAWRERIGNTMLSAAQVIAMRRSYVAGERADDIADRFGMQRSAVNDVVNGRSWQHLLGKHGCPSLSDLQVAAAKATRNNARLTVVQVREIKRRLAAGEMGIDLAAAFCVHKATISDIRQGKIWRDA